MGLSFKQSNLAKAEKSIDVWENDKDVREKVRIKATKKLQIKEKKC